VCEAVELEPSRTLEFLGERFPQPCFSLSTDLWAPEQLSTDRQFF